MKRQQLLERAQSACCPSCGRALPALSFHVDLTNNVIVNGKKALKVPARLAEIIWLLHKHYPAVVPRDDILNRVWGAVEVESKTLDVNVCLARRFLEKIGYTIKAEYKVGYRFMQAPEK